MAPLADRAQVLANLRAQISNNIPIVGAGAGIGLSAKFIEAGGGDLIIIYNSGRFRMAGRGSLAGLMPYGNANDVVVEMVTSSAVVLIHPVTNYMIYRQVKSFQWLSRHPSLPVSAEQILSETCPSSCSNSRV